jgi:hypothetical protein
MTSRIVGRAGESNLTTHEPNDVKGEASRFAPST